MALLNTIMSIFKSKSRKINRKLQVSNCIDLIDEQQSSLAEAYKVLGTNHVSRTFLDDEHYGRDYKDEAIDTIIETSNSHKDGANSLEKYAQKAVGRLVKADGVAPETIVNRFKKS